MGWQKVALKLGAYRKLNPTPLEEFIFYDHPSGRARIRMAMDWKAANYLRGKVRNPNLKIRNKPGNNSVNPSRGDAAKARQQWEQTCPSGSTSDYECKSANWEDRRGCRPDRA